MKIRLAKKIMKQARHLSTASDYWYRRLRDFEYKICYGFVGKKDHRITKAISLTDHWNARRYINELIKTSEKYPFKLRDVKRDAERLEQCSVLKCCGNCHWFDNEDVYGVGWCSNNEHESSCDQVCDEHEF